MMQEELYLEQLNRYYKQYLKNIIEGIEFSPIVLRGGKNRPDNFQELQRAINQFQKFEKKDGKKGWMINWQPWNSKKVGNQQWPSELRVETEEDYIMLLQKEKELKVFKEQLENLLNWQPLIKSWLVERVNKVLELSSDWISICSVVDYVLQNPVKGQYLRGLPVPVHTKFIEHYSGTILSLIRHFNPLLCVSDAKDIENALGLRTKPSLFPLRVLDNKFQDKGLPESEALGIPVEYLRKANWSVGEIWLVENETSLFMLPFRVDAIAICTRGYAVTELTCIPLFTQSRLIYWGDMDEDGYNMLSMFRRMYPNVQSIFMDDTTYHLHKEEADRQPNPYKKQGLLNLSEAEALAFEKLKGMNGRIEQEKLQLAYVYGVIAGK